MNLKTIIITAIVVSLMCGTASAGNWIARQGNLNHTGVADCAGPTTNNLLWSKQVVGDWDEFAGPIVVDGVIITVPKHNANLMNATYINNQTIKWSFLVGGVDATPTYCSSNGLLFVISISGTLFAVHASDGTEAWHKNVSVWYHSDAPPVFSIPENAVFEMQNGTLYKYDMNTGVEAWNTSLLSVWGGWVSRSFGLVYHDGMIYVSTWNTICDRMVIGAFYSNTGTEYWNYSDNYTGDGIWDSDMTLYDDYLITGMHGGSMCDGGYDVMALYLNGTLKWGTDVALSVDDPVQTTPSVKDGLTWVVVTDTDDDTSPSRLCALYADNGTVKYNVSAGSTKGYTSIVLGMNYLYFGLYGGDVKCFDYNANLIWNYTLPNNTFSQMALVDQKLYITCDDGKLYCFGASSSSSNNIVLGANKYGMLRKSVTSSQTFSTIAGEFSHDICFTWWDSTNDRWESYYSGDSYNSAKSVPEHDSYFVLMDGTGENVSCSVAAAENVNIPIGWSSTYLRESASKSITAIKSDMGGNCADIYAWDSTASGTGAWTNTGAFSVLPNQGILVSASSGFTWDGSVS